MGWSRQIYEIYKSKPPAGGPSQINKYNSWFGGPGKCKNVKDTSETPDEWNISNVLIPLGHPQLKFHMGMIPDISVNLPIFTPYLPIILKFYPYLPHNGFPREVGPLTLAMNKFILPHIYPIFTHNGFPLWVIYPIIASWSLPDGPSTKRTCGRGTSNMLTFLIFTHIYPIFTHNHFSFTHIYPIWCSPMSWDPGALLHIMMILPHIYPIFTHNASNHPMTTFWWLATARDGLRTQRMHGDRWGFEPIMAIMKKLYPYLPHIYPKRGATTNPQHQFAVVEISIMG